MKFSKNMCYLILATILMENLLPANHIWAENTTTSNDTVIEDGVIISNPALQDAINGYFSTKEICMETNSSNTVSSLSAISVSDSISDTVSLLQQGVMNMEEYMSLSFSNIENEALVLAVTEDVPSETTVYTYEWIGMDYTPNGSQTSDYMGYGVQHILIFHETDTGAYQLVDDIFSDEFMTGIVSPNYIAENFEIFSQYVSEVSTFQSQFISANATEIASTTATAPYNAANAVLYANLWCGFSASDRSAADPETGLVDEDTKQHTSLYNSSVYYTFSSDCANFVSQCLVAGGLSQDDTWKSGGLVSANYTTAWKGAKYLANYLRDNRGFSEVAATNTSILPGNPVFWRNPSGSPTGHQMICTGKNSAGIPVVNAHNPDLYRVPYTRYSTDHDLYTSLIVTSYAHANVGYSYNTSTHWKYCTHCMQKENEEAHTASSTYTYDTSSHWKKCTKCNAKLNMVNHNWILSGTTKTCRFCGYTTTNTTSLNESNISDSVFSTTCME